MTGVLLMAHGTPASLDEMPEYLTLVRGGRPPSAELVAEMRHNYEAIGGRSPLTDLTLAQAEALRATAGRCDVPVAVGMRNWTPFIEDALAELARGRRHARHRHSAGPAVLDAERRQVLRRRDARRCRPASSSCAVDSFHLIRCSSRRSPSAFARRRPAGRRRSSSRRTACRSASSRAATRYANEVAATAAAVAERAGIGSYRVAYQSAGRTPEPWIGPDLSDLIRERARRARARFLVVPVGFVCDHTEILFDIDIQAQGRGRRVGATLRRTESLNTSPTFIAMLEDLVRRS